MAMLSQTLAVSWLELAPTYVIAKQSSSTAAGNRAHPDNKCHWGSRGSQLPSGCDHATTSHGAGKLLPDPVDHKLQSHSLSLDTQSDGLLSGMPEPGRGLIATHCI